MHHASPCMCPLILVSWELGFSDSIVTLSIRLHKIEECYTGLTAPAKTNYYYYTGCWWITNKIMLLQWLANGSTKGKNPYTQRIMQ